MYRHYCRNDETIFLNFNEDFQNSVFISQSQHHSLGFATHIPDYCDDYFCSKPLIVSQNKSIKLDLRCEDEDGTSFIIDDAEVRSGKFLQKVCILQF